MGRPSILVVEDNAIVARDIQVRLEGLNYRVPDIAPNGEQAVASAVRIGPDLVLMDIRLGGGMDGVDAAREIRDRCGIPVVYVTAYSDDETIARARTAGAYGYVLKPCETGHLQAAIEVALETHRQDRLRRAACRQVRRILQAIPQAVVAVDAGGRVVEVNAAGEALIGCDADRARGEAVAELMTILASPGGDTVDNPLLRALRTGETCGWAHPVWVRACEGHRSRVVLQARAFETPNEAGAVLVAQSVDRAVGEASSGPSLRLVAEMAGGIAHHFNNLLTVIEGYARLLKQGWRSEKELQECLDRVLEASGRATRLTRQLLDFARDRASRPEQIDVEASVTEAIEVVRPGLPRAVRILDDRSADGATVLADPSQLRQVWAALLINARDAMREGGTITVRTSLQAGRAGEPGRVAVVVEDTGAGMDAYTLSRAFDPFFTTKQLDQGAGLGLTAVRCFLEQIGGRIHVESRPGEGTRVEVSLPPAEPAEDIDSAATPEGVVAGARVIVVDDEESVLRMAAAALARSGMKVSACISGREAVEQVHRDPGGVDLVVLDMVMPGMDGAEAYARMADVRPDLPVVATTGFDASELVQSLPDEANVEVLAKPWTPSELVAAVRRCLRK